MFWIDINFSDRQLPANRGPPRGPLQYCQSNGNMIRQLYGAWINKDGPDVVGMLQLALKLPPVTVQP